MAARVPAGQRWLDPSHFLFPTPNDADTLWKTAEHIMIINFMLAAIGGYHRGR